MEFGLILINLNLSFWLFLYLDATSATCVKFSFRGTFCVAVALHLRLEFLAAINSVISSMFHRRLELVFIKWLVLRWSYIEKHSCTLLLPNKIISIFSFWRFGCNFINFKVHCREVLGACDRFTQWSISVAFALQSWVRHSVDFLHLISSSYDYLRLLIMLS